MNHRPMQQSFDTSSLLNTYMINSFYIYEIPSDKFAHFKGAVAEINQTLIIDNDDNDKQNHNNKNNNKSNALFEVELLTPYKFKYPPYGQMEQFINKTRDSSQDNKSHKLSLPTIQHNAYYDIEEYKNIEDYFIIHQ